MVKNSHFVIYVVCLCVWYHLVNSEPNGSTTEPLIEVNDSTLIDSSYTVTDTISRAEKAKAYYKTLVGIAEEGTNAGPFVNKVMKVVGLDNQAHVDATGGGYPWCAAVICYVFEKYGIPNPKSAWSPEVAVFNVIYNKGDPFPTSVPKNQVYVHSLYYNNLGRIGHVGFTDKITKGAIIAYEGNINRSGYRDGGAFDKIIRPKQNIHKISAYE